MSTKNYTKGIGIVILTIALLCSAVLVPNILAFKSGITSGSADYVVLEGVAGNDYYDSVQYSYKVNQWAHDNINGYPTYTPSDVYFNASKSLRIGATEYGEFATPQYAGIAYGMNSTEWDKTESWAPGPVAKKDWIQGWVLYVNYTRQTKLRCLLAWSEYSDFVTEEGGRKVYTWKGQYQPNDPLANITAGSMSVSGIQVLYDSARLVVARATVVIHDNVYNEDFCKITFTIAYEKDTKYAKVFKDYKTLLDPKDLDQISDFAFSERYELDIARRVNPENTAYIHYYHNWNDTVYQHPLTQDTSYDVLQAYDPRHQYIFFAGYWPNATEYSVYSTLVPDPLSGDTTVLPPGFARPDIPPPPNGPDEANTPWVVVQWRYNSTKYANLLHWLAKRGGGIDPETGLYTENKREIRFVEVIGMTDYNSDPYPAKDAKDLVVNQIDAEVQYLLDHQVFNPEDLTTVYVDGANEPFMWIGLGQSAATTDSAGAGLVTWLSGSWNMAPFMLFDRNDTMFPWIAPVVGMKGTIPYGLSDFGGNYYEQFSNSAKGTGTDTTLYMRTALKGFAFGVYDDDPLLPPQPIAGGPSWNASYWYPSKDPLTERWTNLRPGWLMSKYDSVDFSPNGILTLGGMKANGLTRYFNDFSNAVISREGSSAYALVNGGTVTGSAPTSDSSKNTFDYFPISTWNSSQSTFGYKDGYAVISLVRDINGTRGLSIYGWDGRDTFWAAAWASQYLGPVEAIDNWIPPGTVALILNIEYTGGSNEPKDFRITKALGTITELGTNEFANNTAYGFDKGCVWTAWENYLKYLPEYPEFKPSTRATTYDNVWWYEKLKTCTDALVQFDG